MSSFFTIILIAISLSMDAFSLALAYGLYGMNSKEKFWLSMTVGIYHFIMPLIGLTFGSLLKELNLNLNIIATIILIYIGIDLIITSFKEKDTLKISVSGFLLFGLSVSLDSLSLGIGLPAITKNYFISAIMFSVTSFFFTYIGLISGYVIGKKIGEYSKIMGGIILIIIAIIMFIS